MILYYAFVEHFLNFQKNSRPPHSDFVGDNRAIVGSPFSPQLRSQTGPVYNLLQQLIKEAGSVAVHEEVRFVSHDRSSFVAANKTF